MSVSRIFHSGMEKAFFSTNASHCKEKVRMPDARLIVSFLRSRIDSACVNEVCDHPRIIENYLRIAAQMKELNQLPLVHGQTSGFAIPQRIVGALGYNGLERLRTVDESVEAKVAQQELVQMAMKKKQDYLKSPELTNLFAGLKSMIFQWKHSKCIDKMPKYRPHLLSITIGGLHTETFESPLHLVFGGKHYCKSIYYTTDPIPGNISLISRNVMQSKGCDMICSGMRAKGYSEKKIESLVKQLPPLFDEAYTLPIGQLIVIGVPQDMLDVAYSCEEYGFPNGQTMDCATGQARIILTPEVLRSKRITMVNAMDFKEVDAFCPHVDKTPVVKEMMKEIFQVESPKNTEKEALAVRGYEGLTEKIDRVISDFL